MIGFLTGGRGKRSCHFLQSRLVPRTAPNEVCFFSRSYQRRQAGPVKLLTTIWRSPLCILQLGVKFTWWSPSWISEDGRAGEGFSSFRVSVVNRIQEVILFAGEHLFFYCYYYYYYEMSIKKQLSDCSSLSLQHRSCGFWIIHGVFLCKVNEQSCVGGVSLHV